MRANTSVCVMIRLVRTDGHIVFAIEHDNEEDSVNDQDRRFSQFSQNLTTTNTYIVFI